MGLFAGTVVAAFCLATLHPAAAGVALIPLLLLGWLVVTRGRDLLTVHRDGFTFRHRGIVWRYRWDQVDWVDVQLGADRRGRILKLTTNDGELVSFGSLMGGLDALYYAHATEGGRTTAPMPVPSAGGIGALLSTHGSTLGRGYLPAGIVGGCLLLFAIALLVFSLDVPTIEPRDVATAAGCTAAALAFLALLLWLALADRNDELRIHEHGFAYRHRGTVHECRWDEIADYEQRHLDLRAVMRQDGTWISLSEHVPAVREHILPRVRIAQDHSPPPSPEPR